MWSEGQIGSTTSKNAYKYWVKHYETGSEFGIDGGKISKLTICKMGEYENLVNYDRGWDVEVPDDEEIAKVYAVLIEKYN